MMTAVHSAARVTQPKPKRIRKNRKREQHRILASQRRSDDPINIKESCSAVGQKHWIANNTQEEPEESCSAVGQKHWIANNTREESDRSI